MANFRGGPTTPLKPPHRPVVFPASGPCGSVCDHVLSVTRFSLCSHDLVWRDRPRGLHGRQATTNSGGAVFARGLKYAKLFAVIDRYQPSASAIFCRSNHARLRYSSALFGRWAGVGTDDKLATTIDSAGPCLPRSLPRSRPPWRQHGRSRASRNCRRQWRCQLQTDHRSRPGLWMM
jgi:hypothetical protein